MIIFLITLLTLTALLGGTTAFADSFVEPEPAIVESKDGTHLFSFNPNANSDFPEMGVYRNTKPLELVYAIPFGSMTFLNDYYFSADMKYFVHFPTITQDTVILFYSDGELIESYRIPNLVRDKSVVQYSVSMAMWYDFSSRMLDTEKNTFTVTTNDGLTYIFDITTGKAVEGEVIITNEVWSPFNTMEEEPPKTPHDTLTAEHVEFDPADYITDHSPVDLPLDGQITTNITMAIEEHPYVAEKAPLNTSVIIGIIITSVCIAGLVAALVIYMLKKRA